MTDLLGLTGVDRPHMPDSLAKTRKVWLGKKEEYPAMVSESADFRNIMEPGLAEAIALSLEQPQAASSSHQHAPFVDQDGLPTFSIYGAPKTPQPRGVKGHLNESTPPTQAKRPRPEDDLNRGFKDAYDSKLGLAYDDKNKILYIAGMRANPGDVVAGWDSAFNPADLKNSQRWQTALRFLTKHPEIKKVRGHSMGGVVASQMADILDRNKKFEHVRWESYNSPFSPLNRPSTKIKRWRHVGDIVSMQDAGAEEVNFGNFWDLLAQHDYAGFVS